MIFTVMVFYLLKGGSQSTSRNLLSHSSPNSSEALWIRLAASCLSGLTEALLTPFERVQTLLQIPRYNTRFTCFVDACHQLGLRESFTGFSSLLNGFPDC